MLHSGDRKVFPQGQGTESDVSEIKEAGLHLKLNTEHSNVRVIHLVLGCKS